MKNHIHTFTNTEIGFIKSFVIFWRPLENTHIFFSILIFAHKFILHTIIWKSPHTLEKYSIRFRIDDKNRHTSTICKYAALKKRNTCTSCLCLNAQALGMHAKGVKSLLLSSDKKNTHTHRTQSYYGFDRVIHIWYRVYVYYMHIVFFFSRLRCDSVFE